MKILFITYAYPPYNNIGAVRSSKLTEYLKSFGHDIKVLTADKILYKNNLAWENPGIEIYRTKWSNINKPFELIKGGKKNVVSSGSYLSDTQKKNRLIQFISKSYKALIYWPDEQIGWFRYAKKIGTEILNDWRPDLIYASAKPFTSFIIANSLSKKFGIPWVGELRDLWVDNHHYQFPRWRYTIENLIEKRIISNACGLVTVSNTWSKYLINKYNKSTVCIPNGFVAEDFEKARKLQVNNLEKNSILKIVYTGNIYEHNQDPSPLLFALQMNPDWKGKVKVIFYGQNNKHKIENLIKKYNLRDVEGFISFRSSVSYLESLQIQTSADVLLLLNWNDKKENGVLPGKLFEYAGSLRPILCIGYEKGEAVELIHDRDLGFVSNNADFIGKEISKLIEQKRNNTLNDRPFEPVADLTRKQGAKKLNQFLIGLIK
ncbi:glycosyltransferase family 4 protein [Fulvivirga kasyanovii]|uniref:glycosyltransferase n=1 Tax=Fulvivirga kasyanovii TaxID=396812 RepID=UPI0031D5B9F8